MEYKKYELGNGILYNGHVLDVLKDLPDESVDCIVTSPPYWGLRDYGVKRQIGLEPTLEEYLEKLLRVTAELKRILKKTGVMFWNHGDCYGGSGKGRGKGEWRKKSKNLYHEEGLHPNPIKSIPAKCMALQNYRLILRMVDEQGWILRNIIIWYKPNHMPSSVRDRFSNAYEPVFMLVKNKKYWFDLDIVREPHNSKADYSRIVKTKSKAKNIPWYGGQVRDNHDIHTCYNPLGKNPGDLWTIPTQPFPEAHFAVFPERLVEPMIKAGCPQWICKECGKIKERITKVEYQKHRPSGGEYLRKDVNEKRAKIGNWGTMANNLIAERYTIGWKDCGCNAGWEPGVVLDPFMGSGTTAKVAEKLGRRWIGIEISEKYCEIIKKGLKPYIMEKSLL